VRGRDDFWIHEGRPVGRMHVAFDAESGDAVDAFHAAALEASGRDNGAPGVRTEYSETYYAAYVLDPNGNNIEAVFHGDAPTRKGREVVR
jgi:catechol 2,3-dioxygenase-like lactoylglutathione lyase family enzyme